MDVAHTKYWNDQIKSMVGPCMITFAIPLTIPGLTITLVAFSNEKSFPLYGTLHITGLILSIISVFLIIFGCMLKFIWKPIILPDIERQLSPRESVRSERGNSFYRKEIERIQRANLKENTTESKRKSRSTKTEETVLGSHKDTETVRSTRTGEENDQTKTRHSEQGEKGSAKGDGDLPALPRKDFSIFYSPRGVRLPPIETTDRVGVSRSRCSSTDHDGQEISRGSRSSDPGETATYRKKKKKRKRHNKREEEEEEGEGNERQRETVYETPGSPKQPPGAPKQLQLPKLQKTREHLVDENFSGLVLYHLTCYYVSLFIKYSDYRYTLS